MSETTDPTRGTGEMEPPPRMVEIAVEASLSSPCRSKRGAVVFRERLSIGRGCNDKPPGFSCDWSDACKASCRSEAVHAEQKALLRAGLHAQGCDLLHVKTVDGQLVPSGGPSCVECSKLALAAGIAAVWLYHENGWRRYDAADFHRRSLASVERTNGNGDECGGDSGVSVRADASTAPGEMTEFQKDADDQLRRLDYARGVWDAKR